MSPPLDEDAPELAHEINVTPFIDVMLVLLIIFMVAAPLATVDTPVELPTSHATARAQDDHPVYLNIDVHGHWTLNQQAVTPAGLKPALDHHTQGDHQRRILLRADRRVDYAQLMQAMNALRDAGYPHLGLVGQADPAP